jgi:hypothetical protein
MMLTEIGRRMDKPSENFNKEVENVRNYQTESITEPRNTPEGFNSILDEIEEQISRLEDTAIELTQGQSSVRKKEC